MPIFSTPMCSDGLWSVSGLSGAWAILRTASQLQDTKEIGTWTRVCAVGYTDVGSSGHLWESVTFSKFTF